MREIAHLARRFFRSLVARRPGPSDQQLVAQLLQPDEAAVFWSQPIPDMTHAVRVARRIPVDHPRLDDLQRAALLHDVGKRRSGIATIRRSLATLLAALRIPLGSQMRVYLDHGPLGAAELADLGCETLVVEFARHHHGQRPDSCSEDDWETLLQADHE